MHKLVRQSSSMLTISVLPSGQHQDWLSKRRGCEFIPNENPAIKPETIKGEQLSDPMLTSSNADKHCGADGMPTNLVHVETPRQCFQLQDVIAGEGQHSAEEHARGFGQVTNVGDCDKAYGQLILLIENRNDLLNHLCLLLRHLVILGTMKVDHVQVMLHDTIKYIHHQLCQVDRNCHINGCPHNQTPLDISYSYSMPETSNSSEYIDLHTLDKFDSVGNDQIQTTLESAPTSKRYISKIHFDANRQIAQNETEDGETALCSTPGRGVASPTGVETPVKSDSVQMLPSQIPPPPPLLWERCKSVETRTSSNDHGRSSAHTPAATLTSSSKDEMFSSPSEYAAQLKGDVYTGQITSLSAQLPPDLPTRRRFGGAGKRLLRWAKLDQVHHGSIWDNSWQPDIDKGNEPWLDLEQLAALFEARPPQTEDLATSAQSSPTRQPRFSPTGQPCQCFESTGNARCKQNNKCSSHFCMNRVGDRHGENMVTVKRRSVSRGRSEVKLLDRQRCVNISIFLRQFRPSGLDLVSLVRHRTAGPLTADQLRGLIKLLPSEKEVHLMKKFKGNTELLDPAELFLVHLVQIPNYQKAIHYMLLREEFHTYLKGINEALTTTSEVVQELITSPAWSGLFHAILEIGNKLNEGSSYGGAQGFRLDSLLKLNDVKSSTSKATLLHYLIQQIQHHRPEFLEVKKFLPRIKVAVDNSKSEIFGRLQSLHLQVSDIRQQLSEQDDQHCAEINEFVHDAVVKLKLAEGEVESLNYLAKRCSAYFCEDFANFRLHECLHILQIFLENLHTAETEVCENQNLATTNREQRRITAGELQPMKSFQKNSYQRRLSRTQYTEEKLFELLAGENAINDTTSFERETKSKQRVHQSTGHDSAVEIAMPMPTSFVRKTTADLGCTTCNKDIVKSTASHETLVPAASASVKTGESMIECLELDWKVPIASRRRSSDTKRLDHLELASQLRERTFLEPDLHPPLINDNRTTTSNSGIQRELSESSNDGDVTLRAN